MSRKSSIKKIQRSNSESKDLQAAVMMDLYLKGYSPVTANFTGNGLSECDVLAVSKANLLYEFEVKISRSDFKKDFTKEHKHKLLTERKGTKEYSKYVRGKRTDEKETVFLIPNYFTYLVPYNLVSVDEVPEYAGLLYMNETCDGFIWERKPPKLHTYKMDDKMLRAITHNLTCKFIFGSAYLTYINNNIGVIDGYINKGSIGSEDLAADGDDVHDDQTNL